MHTNLAQKKGDQLLEFETEKTKLFWNQDAKMYPKTHTLQIGHIKLA